MRSSEIYIVGFNGAYRAAGKTQESQKWGEISPASHL